jgi:diguanylate cyclase (GGDEF)-like protein/PAS domain S-box-containing protein
MVDNFYRQVVKDSPLGYAYHRIICDELGTPVDYEFLEVNLAFENITGLKASQIIGKRLTEVLPKISDDRFDWIQHYGDIALNGGSIEFKQYSEQLERWFQVKASSFERLYFITQFSEITNKIPQLADLQQLLSITDRLLSATSENLDFQVETDAVKKLVGAAYSTFHLYDQETKKFIGKAISGEIESIEKANKRFGSEIMNSLLFDGVPDNPLLKSGQIRTYPSVFPFIGSFIPEKVVGQLVDELGLGEVVLVLVGTPTKTYGCFTHFMPQKDLFQKHQIMELHAKQFGLALSRGFLQKRLQRELEFSHALFYALPGYLYVYDQEGKLVRWNKMHEEMTGYSAGELAGMTMANWFEGDDLKRVSAAVAQVFETGYSSVEAPLMKKDGSKVWIRSSGVPFEIEGFHYFVGIGVDISESRQREEALKASELRFRRAIEEAPIPIMLHAEDGEVLSLSHTWKELTGYTIEDTPTTYEWALKAYGAENPNVRKVIQSLYHLEERQYDGCFQVITKKGEVLQWDFYSAAMGKMQDGRNIAISVGIDITEKMKLDLELKDERNLLRTTLLSVGDGIISTDLHGAVVYVNKVAESLTGWKQSEAEGKPIQQVFSIMNEITRLPSENIVKKVISTRKIHEIANHTILTAKDGREYPIEDSAAPIIREDGQVAGAVLVFRDFTEKKRRNEEILFLSYHDHLTGLYNRRFFDEWMDRIDSEGIHPVSLVMADINGLKLMNDAFGYRAGDHLLQRTAEILKQECGGDGIAVRVGGDEFVLLLSGITRNETELIIKRIKEKISKSRVSNMVLSISIGMGVKTQISEDLRKIYKDAESDMYKHKLYESLSFRSRTIGLITSALFEKSDREMAHSKRVGNICMAIAKRMAFSDEGVSRMEIAGLMHDIGKIGVPEAILNKPTSLTPSEWEKMKRHPEIGYRILLSTQEYSEVADFILAHHERWDGKGYPRGLAGEAIPLESRIITVADSYDAMTTQRPYKVGLDWKEAIEEMQHCAGTQFDPLIVDELISYVKSQEI